MSTTKHTPAKQSTTPLLALPDAVKTAIDQVSLKFPIEHKRSALLPALTFAQEANHGWLSEALIIAVADYLEVAHSQAFEVATFYSLYDLAPVGRHKVSLCNSVSCMLCGAKPLIAHLQEKYGVTPGETTQDGTFTFKVVTCLGACIGAPVIQIDKCYYENVTIEALDKLIEALE